MRRVVVCCLVAWAGCYDPNVDCPLGRCQQLVADPPTSIDASLADARNTEPPTDAAPSSPPVDGAAPPPPPPPPPDAAPPPKPCAPGCAGTCDDGVCVITCSGNEACEQEVVCPITGPCRVVCNGRKACKDGVRCGLGRCTVTCNGEEACRKGVRCGVSCACDVTCGSDGCDEKSVCPHPACEAGDGCTSSPNSCNAC